MKASTQVTTLGETKHMQYFYSTDLQ